MIFLKKFINIDRILVDLYNTKMKYFRKYLNLTISKKGINKIFQFEVIFFCTQDICVLFRSYFFITCLIYLIKLKN